MIRLTPGPPATVADLRRAQDLDRLLRQELTRVRAAAVAWRNGLAGLLVALVGFGLLRGRTDISTLATRWAVVVGVLLLFALAVGAAGALALLRAAHGQPRVTPVSALGPAVVGDHREAVAAARALRAGIGLVLACAALLVAAVGTTWYGPARAVPSLFIRTATTMVCGPVSGTSSGTVTIATAAGTVSVPLTEVVEVRPVSACP